MPVQRSWHGRRSCRVSDGCHIAWLPRAAVRAASGSRHRSSSSSGFKSLPGPLDRRRVGDTPCGASILAASTTCERSTGREETPRHARSRVATWIARQPPREAYRSCSSRGRRRDSRRLLDRPYPRLRDRRRLRRAAATSPRATPAMPARSSRRAAFPAAALGLVAYAAAVRRRESGNWADMRLGDDFVSATGAWMLFADLPNALIKLDFEPDRAAVLEQAWERAWGSPSPLGRRHVRDMPLGPVLTTPSPERNERAGRLPRQHLSTQRRRRGAQDREGESSARLSVDGRICRRIGGEPPRARRSQGRTTSSTCSADAATCGYLPPRSCRPAFRGSRLPGVSCVATRSSRRTSWTAATSTPRRHRRFKSSGRDSSPSSRVRTQSAGGLPCVVPACSCSSTITTRSRATPGRRDGRGSPAVPIQTVRAARDARENGARQAVAILFADRGCRGVFANGAEGHP